MKTRHVHAILFIMTILAFTFLSLTSSSAETINYIYDDLNRLIQAENTSNGSVVEFQYDAVGNRTQRTASVAPVNLIAALLYADFTAYGLHKWDGSAWSQLSGISPVKMVAAGSNLYADINGSGIWQWNGAAWSQLNGISPTKMVASGSNLYADLGSGIWQWNGSAWSQLSGISPVKMVASGSNLYADLGAGIWQWNGAAWSQLNWISPASMEAN